MPRLAMLSIRQAASRPNPPLPSAASGSARTLALNASRSASLAGVSAIGAGIADSAELDLASGGESNPKFGMSLAMLIENACKPGAGRGAPPLPAYYTMRLLISSQPPNVQTMYPNAAPRRAFQAAVPDPRHQDGLLDPGRRPGPILQPLVRPHNGPRPAPGPNFS